MANNINPRPLTHVIREARAAGFSDASIRLLWDTFTRTEKTLTNKGEVQAVANVTGRIEPLSSTLQNVTSAGQLSSADAIAADGSTFGRVAITALTSNQPDLSKAGVIGKTAANIAQTSNLKWRTMAHSAAQVIGLTITGHDAGAGVAQISGSSSTLRVPGETDASMGSFLALGLANSTKYQIYKDTPNFDGTGSVTVTTDADSLFSSSSRTYLGNNTTPAGGAGDTTGTSGGLSGPRTNLT